MRFSAGDYAFTFGRKAWLFRWKESLRISSFGSRFTIGSGLSVGNIDRVSGLINAAKSWSSSTWTINWNLSEGKDQSTHKLRSTSSPNSLVGPIGFVSYLHFQLHLVHRCDARDFDIDIWLEISRIVFVSNECLHFVSKKLDILERGTKINVNSELFPHGIRSRHVLNPHCIEYDVWYLGQLVGVDVLKDCKKKRDVLDNQLIIADINSV